MGAAERHDDLIVALHPVAQLMGGGFHARRGAARRHRRRPRPGAAPIGGPCSPTSWSTTSGAAPSSSAAPRPGWRGLVDREERAGRPRGRPPPGAARPSSTPWSPSAPGPAGHRRRPTWPPTSRCPRWSPPSPSTAARPPSRLRGSNRRRPRVGAPRGPSRHDRTRSLPMTERTRRPSAPWSPPPAGPGDLELRAVPAPEPRTATRPSSTVAAVSLNRRRGAAPRVGRRTAGDPGGTSPAPSSEPRPTDRARPSARASSASSAAAPGPPGSPCPTSTLAADPRRACPSPRQPPSPSPGSPPTARCSSPTTIDGKRVLDHRRLGRRRALRGAARVPLGRRRHRGGRQRVAGPGPGRARRRVGGGRHAGRGRVRHHPRVGRRRLVVGGARPGGPARHRRVVRQLVGRPDLLRRARLLPAPRGAPAGLPRSSRSSPGAAAAPSTSARSPC